MLTVMAGTVVTPAAAGREDILSGMVVVAAAWAVLVWTALTSVHSVEWVVVVVVVDTEH